MTTWTGQLALSALTADFAVAAQTITSNVAATPVFGDGSIKTSVTHLSSQFVAKTTQWQLQPNADGTPVLWIGSLDRPTYIWDTSYTGDWSNGGRFRNLSTSTNLPIVVMQGVNYLGLPAGREAALTGNKQDVIFHLQNCNLSWPSPNNVVPFLGKKSIVKNTVFYGPNNPNSSVSGGCVTFQSFHLDSYNVSIIRWGVGIKVEYGGPAWYEGFSFQQCARDTHVWYPANDTTAGYSDGSINLSNCASQGYAYNSAEAYGAINVWRTFTGKTANAAGQGVSGSARYFLFDGSLYTESYNINLSATATNYQVEFTNLGSIATARKDLAYFIKPGERVKIAGFSAASLNGVFAVQGKYYNTGLAVGYFHDTQELWVTGKNAVTEGVKPCTIDVLPPVSDATGKFANYKARVVYARRNNNTGSNTLSELLAGTNSYSDKYERLNWRVVEIPPYPLQRQQQDFTVAAFPATAGEGVQWNTLAVNDPLITVTNAATVAAYTALDTAAKCYDYAEWVKRQTVYHAFPAYDLGICTKSGTTLDFGALNVTIDSAAASALATAPGAVTIKAGAFDGSIKTNGTVTTNIALTNAVTATALLQAAPTNLTGLTLTGNLTYNTANNVTVTLTNCAITGTVSNASTGTVTITNNGSTIATIGARIVTRPLATLSLKLPAGSQIYVTDGTGALVEAVASSGTSYTRDTTGGTGTWAVKVGAYLKQAQGYTFGPALGGTSAYAIDFVADGAVTQADPAVVAAYIAADTVTKAFDLSKLFLVNNFAGALVPGLAKSGSFVESARAIVIDATASAVYAETATTITLKAAVFTGNLRSTGGTVTLANGASVLGYIEDINGPRNAFAFALNGLIAGSRVTLFDKTGAVIESVVVPGTSYAWGKVDGYSGLLTWVAVKAGYTPTVGSQTIAAGALGFDAVARPEQMLNTLGPQYTGQNSASMTVALDTASVPNKTLATVLLTADATAQALLNELHDFAQTIDGAKWLKANGADAMPAFSYGIAQAQTVAVKAGTVGFDSRVSVRVQAYVTNPITLAIGGGLGAVSYESIAAGGLTTEQTAMVAAIKAKTDALPTQPAAKGDAMTLTAAYDAAKTAAMQSSVDQIAAELGDLPGLM